MLAMTQTPFTVSEPSCYEFKNSCNLFAMNRAGLEPATNGLKVRYSTN